VYYIWWTVDNSYIQVSCMHIRMARVLGCAIKVSCCKASAREVLDLRVQLETITMLEGGPGYYTQALQVRY
jgi:hypothetical protein